jgi:6-phosphogluconate dehydrogenase (decarboxylating)
MTGFGRMGANMAHRLVRGGQRVVMFDVNEAANTRQKCWPPGATSSVGMLSNRNDITR